MKQIWLVAAENGALPRGKVGGIADVIRELPPALADAGLQVTVITPAYGLFNKLAGTRFVSELKVQFGGKPQIAEIHQLRKPGSPVLFIFIEHPLITTGNPGVIYHDDGPLEPFATDASRFAFFCAAVAALVEHHENTPDVLHLHDWHLGLVPVLRQFDPSLHTLRSVRTVFTIHNLAFQGTRPLRGHTSSFETWFPQLSYQREKIADPRFTDCVNPMAAAIRLADKLNTVSPTYSTEILQAANPAAGFSGGEGLEGDLRSAAEHNRLLGILNGCTYPRAGGRRPGWSHLLEVVSAERHLLKDNPPAQQTLQKLPRARPTNLLVSIGRSSAQKVSLFLQPTRTHPSALEAILDLHGKSLVFVMLGSGDREIEGRLIEIASRQRNFLYLRGYSEPLPELLYRAGDLFLMPSSFEPCGISQMLAMRAGQACVVHAVGGLQDTVEDEVNGFTFTGKTPRVQAENFVASITRALAIKHQDHDHWNNIREHAAAMRFSWKAAAATYIADLYEP